MLLQYPRQNGKPKLSMVELIEVTDSEYARLCVELLRSMFPDAGEWQILATAYYMVLHKHGGEDGRARLSCPRRPRSWS